MYAQEQMYCAPKKKTIFKTYWPESEVERTCNPKLMAAVNISFFILLKIQNIYLMPGIHLP